MADRAGGSAFAYNMLYKFDIEGLLVGVDENSPEMTIQVFPNPAQDYISFVQRDITSRGKGTVQIIDLQGRIALQVPTSELIDIRSLAKSDYWIRLELNGSIHFARFSKNWTIWSCPA